MAFREYGNYDGMGLADLVRNKQVTPAELLEIRARDQKIPLTPRQHVILLASTRAKPRYTLT